MSSSRWLATAPLADAADAGAVLRACRGSGLATRPRVDRPHAFDGAEQRSSLGSSSARLDTNVRLAIDTRTAVMWRGSFLGVRMAVDVGSRYDGVGPPPIPRGGGLARPVRNTRE